MNTHPSTEFASGHQFLEALRWHDGRLWASDFFGKGVLRFDADGSSEVVATIEGAPSGLGFLDDGSVLVVSQSDAAVARIAVDGTVSDYADFKAFAGGGGNDMLVTSQGHAYVGNFGFVPGVEEPRSTTLVHLDPHGTASPVGGDVVFPNGMAVTGDGVLLVAETYVHRITAFDRAEDGSLSNQRTWAQLDDSMHPDGIALDSDGGVWFGNAMAASADSGFYRCVEGGEVTDVVPVPDAWAVACAFGGERLDTLYMSCNATTVQQFVGGRSAATIRTADIGRTGAPLA